MNLLTETIEVIKRSGHEIKDIIFIGSEESGHSCAWDEYKTLADIEYNPGFGGQEIATDLIIVFSDGVKMWRGEDDRSEWWNYSKPFKRPQKTKKIKYLTKSNNRWDSIEGINE